MSGDSDGLSSYRRFLKVTIGIVCLLILAGGVVRSTGSGMGCPDWPKCFGQWIPPTDITQLPPDYKETYSQGRHKKNLRAANYLDLIGFQGVAHQLRTDKSILVEETFNPTKTWIEYLNRLLGVITGFLILINVILAFRLRTENRVLLWLAILNLFLVGFQGWVGSIVVSTNLLSGMITFHMVLALIILAILILNLWKSVPRVSSISPGKNFERIYWIGIISIVLFSVQVVFGTQVREGIDQVAKSLGEAQRDSWISQLGLVFYIHRSYSIFILFCHGLFGYLIISNIKEQRLQKLVYFLGSMLMIEVITGIVMAYFGIPAFFQPLHLLFATIIFALDFYLILEMNNIRKESPIANPEIVHI